MDQRFTALIEKHEREADWRRGVERAVAATNPVMGLMDARNESPDVYYPSIRERVALLCEGDGEAAERLADQVDRARRHIDGNVDGAAEAVERALAHWSGAAAEDFGRYVEKAQRAFERVDEAMQSVERVQDAYATMVRQLHDRTAALLEDAVTVHKEGASAHVVSHLSALTEAVVGALGAATGGPLLTTVLGIASAARPLVDAEIDADNAGRTAKALDAALGSLLDYAEDQQRCFVRALTKVRNHLSGDQLPHLDPPPPQITGGDSFDPDTFRPPQGAPAGVSREPLIPEPTRNGDGHEPPRSDILARLGHVPDRTPVPQRGGVDDRSG